MARSRISAGTMNATYQASEGQAEAVTANARLRFGSLRLPGQEQVPERQKDRADRNHAECHREAAPSVILKITPQ
jgi:hypothetical protein